MIKEALKERQLEQAAALLSSTVASDEIFGFWSSCCQGSERVPKILRYVKRISFDERIPTAAINLMEGELSLSPGFFIEHIDGPEDLLFILIHERNHLILRTLYPDTAPQDDWPAHMFNFAEDVFINAISRRHVPSTLPERFYAQPVEMLLTGRHSRIDWDLINYRESGFNMLKEAHGTLYRQNGALLQALGERHVGGTHFGGYQEWMSLAYRWFRYMQFESKRKKQASVDEDTDVPPEPLPAESDEDQGPEEGHDKEKLDQEKPDEACDTKGETDEDTGKDDSEDEHETPAEPGKQRSTQDDEPDEDGHGGVGEESRGDASDDPGDNSTRETDGHGTGDKAEKGIEAAVKSVVPLVRNDDQRKARSGTGCTRDASGMQHIPMPGLRPNDPVVRLILGSCDLPDIRCQVQVFEGEKLQHVEGLIRGILSERATETSYDGYSVSVPLSVTRRDVFYLSAGEIPVLWQKRVGVERPCIDLYVDVSGSMNRYYGYIPYIYDALKHVTGSIFQFSTRIEEVDPADRYLHTTGGTSFSGVAEHMIKRQARAAILLSDGKCTLPEALIERLKNQFEHFVYIKVQENECVNWERVATEVIVLEPRRTT